MDLLADAPSTSKKRVVLESESEEEVSNGKTTAGASQASQPDDEDDDLDIPLSQRKARSKPKSDDVIPLSARKSLSEEVNAVSGADSPASARPKRAARERKKKAWVASDPSSLAFAVRCPVLTLVMWQPGGRLCDWLFRRRSGGRGRARRGVGRGEKRSTRFFRRVGARSRLRRRKTKQSPQSESPESKSAAEQSSSKPLPCWRHRRKGKREKRILREESWNRFEPLLLFQAANLFPEEKVAVFFRRGRGRNGGGGTERRRRRAGDRGRGFVVGETAQDSEDSSVEKRARSSSAEQVRSRARHCNAVKRPRATNQPLKASGAGVCWYAKFGVLTVSGMCCTELCSVCTRKNGLASLGKRKGLEEDEEDEEEGEGGEREEEDEEDEEDDAPLVTPKMARERERESGSKAKNRYFGGAGGSGGGGSGGGGKSRTGGSGYAFATRGRV
eukprot:676171-Rhodomonas_salina.1